jgi:hypothetical protein
MSVAVSGECAINGVLKSPLRVSFPVMETQPDKADTASTSIARFNGPGRRQPKMGADGRGDAVGAVKPRIAKQGYTRFLTLKDIDQRCRAAGRVKQIMGALESDLGGASNLAEAEKLLVTRASLLAVQCEDLEARFMLGEPHEHDYYLASVNNLRRLLITLGLERRVAKNISVLNPSSFTPLRARLAREDEAADEADVSEVT